MLSEPDYQSKMVEFILFYFFYLYVSLLCRCVPFQQIRIKVMIKNNGNACNEIIEILLPAIQK